MNLKSYLKERADIIDKNIALLLQENNVYPEVIHEAVRYSIFAGGKRIRPVMCLAAAEALGKESKPLLPVACALEMIHTYSLIHDDLPAMDNDDYRRGKLTNHKVFGEGIAVLAGDALLTKAFEVMAAFGCATAAEKLPVVLQVVKEIATASGTLGMIGGQVVDLQSEGKEISKDTLHYIHTRKTGALFIVSIRSGALLSEATEQELTALSVYAEKFGLAFQITDDLLDILGCAEKLGKPVGSDIKNNKQTYPVLYGVDRSKILAREAVEEAVSNLKTLPGNIKPLELLARFLTDRES